MSLLSPCVQAVGIVRDPQEAGEQFRGSAWGTAWGQGIGRSTRLRLTLCLLSLPLKMPPQYKYFSGSPIQHVPLGWPCQAGPSESPGTPVPLYSKGRGLMLRAGLVGVSHGTC